MLRIGIRLLPTTTSNGAPLLLDNVVTASPVRRAISRAASQRENTIRHEQKTWQGWRLQSKRRADSICVLQKLHKTSKKQRKQPASHCADRDLVEQQLPGTPPLHEVRRWGLHIGTVTAADTEWPLMYLRYERTSSSPV